MKRILLAIITVCIFAQTAGAQKYYDYRGRDLPSRHRTETTLHVVFPMYLGLSTLVSPYTLSQVPELSLNDVKQIPSWRSYIFSWEFASLRFTSKGWPFEANVGLRSTFINAQSNIQATYLGVPVRFAIQVGRKGKIFAGAGAEMLVNGYFQNNTSQLFPYRINAEGGISFGFLGIWASYGLTPFYNSGPDSRMLSVGLAIEV